MSHVLYSPVSPPLYFQYNFVGRILGPRGLTAKQLEAETGCKIMVRGKSSMRDKKKVRSSLWQCFRYRCVYSIFLLIITDYCIQRRERQAPYVPNQSRRDQKAHLSLSAQGFILRLKILHDNKNLTNNVKKLGLLSHKTSH